MILTNTGGVTDDPTNTRSWKMFANSDSECTVCMCMAVNSVSKNAY